MLSYDNTFVTYHHFVYFHFENDKGTLKQFELISVLKWAASRQNQQYDCAPAKTQISLGICSMGSEDPSFLHADSEDSDQTGRIPRLI